MPFMTEIYKGTQRTVNYKCNNYKHINYTQIPFYNNIN